MKTEQVEGWEYWTNIAVALVGIGMMAQANLEFAAGLWVFMLARAQEKDIKKREGK